jgi:hypothetical protein
MRISEVKNLAVDRRWWLVMSRVLLLLSATSATAEARECPETVVGENNAATDVIAVQQAVDDGCDTVRLQGTFSFSDMSTGEPLRVVSVSRSVNIVGQLDGQGTAPQIVGGETPFLVEAPGAAVRIAGLRFVGPISRAIQVRAAMEAVVENCVIEAVNPVTNGNLTVAFGIVIAGPFDAPINRVVVTDNVIAGGRPVEVGVLLAPPSGAIHSISIDRNEIRATAHGIDLRSVRGHAQVDDNWITIDNSDRTGDADFPPQLVDGIRCWGEGTCRIVDNWIESHHPNSSGVRLQAAADATVESNSIELTPPEGSSPGAQSSGVQLIEDSRGNLVGRNQVGGTARTAFSVSGPLPLAPSNNHLVLNRHPGLASSFVDTEIGEGALRTVVVGEDGSISDLGTGSVVR